MKFLVINGPNLNLLGRREPDVYGARTYQELCNLCRDYARRRGAGADFFQSNHEGAIIDAIHAAQGKYDAIIINPAAYTHYSYAILDALKAVDVPAYEVHLSHIDQRESFRAVSVTAPACVGQLYGLGFDGYLRAMDYFLDTAPLYVIGDPVAHSKSPLIQNAMLAALGQRPRYGAVRVEKGGLPQWLERARAEGCGGFNATMPHKEDLIPLLDGVDGAARAAGSVNTVVLREGRALGFSTDGPGFLAALREELDIDPAGLSVALLGAGGAAKAVACALTGAGAEAVTVCNRTPQRAQALCGLDPQGRISCAGFDPESLSAAVSRAQLLVNCTSLGMTGEFDSLDFLSALPEGAAVCDLVYQPPETALLRRAREQGRPAMNGLSMLIYQAVLALEHFLDRPLDRACLAAAVREAL